MEKLHANHKDMPGERRKNILLIADKNPHVRDLLKREMTNEGFAVKIAGTLRQVTEMISVKSEYDLLIIDIDLPDRGETGMDILLKGLPGTPPVIVHSFMPDYATFAHMKGIVSFVEKSGNSIETLKHEVSKALFETETDNAPGPLAITDNF